MEVCLCSMFCLPCQFGLTRQRAGLGHCAIGACMVMLPIIILYGIMAAVIITPEIKMINCLTDADNHALIQAANEAGVCNPADPMHCSVALQLCPSMAEFNHALISTYAMTPVFMIAMCSVRPNPISLSLSLSLSRARVPLLSHYLALALSRTPRHRPAALNRSTAQPLNRSSCLTAEACLLKSMFSTAP
jgi:hypothetical protein